MRVPVVGHRDLVAVHTDLAASKGLVGHRHLVVVVHTDQAVAVPGVVHRDWVEMQVVELPAHSYCRVAVHRGPGLDHPQRPYPM